MTEINPEKILNKNPQKLEEKILKAVFKKNSSIDEIIDIINPDMFTIFDYSNIYTAMVKLYKDNNTINPENIQLWFENNGVDISYNIIKKLYNESYTSLNVKNTALIMKELYQRRYMLEKLREIIDHQEQTPTLSTDILENINNVAIKSSEKMSCNKTASRCFEDTSEILIDIDNKLKNRVEESGITTGWNTIDSQLGGFYRKQLVCLGASSGAGKSWVALQTCLQMCLNDPSLKVLYFSLEMSKQELEYRMLSILTGIPCDKLIRPRKYFMKYDENGVLRDYYQENPNSKIVMDFKEKVRNAVEILSTLNITIDDEGGLGIDDVIARINRFNLKNSGVDAVFVDHTYLLKSISTTLNTSDEFGDMYYRLKNIAKKLDCVVYALHQLNMEIKNNSDRRPSIYNIRGSSQIIDNVDILMLLYNANIHHDLIRSNPELKGVIDITFGKVRGNAMPSPIELSFDSCGFKEKEPDTAKGDIINGKIILNQNGEIVELDED